ncbi:APC family permease [Granulicella cerasi]|uniref:APC family permease n=1 Tax=Granulicella cerasi TaxID=741063 RepID=UPI0021DFCE23|nr:amino acid permease [Granulicella cerasi]
MLRCEAVTTANESQTHLVKGLGLFSATAIVMGSMIGSGIFIVPAEMSRTLASPALLIAAWLVTAFMTIVGALSYGELAAMMPKAGGQYVYLREGLGPVWGFLYGWTLFLVIQTGTIAAVAVAFAKFLGVFVPSVSQSRWIWHMGQGNVGLNTANLVAMVTVVFLTWLNTRGVKLGAAVQNIFTSAKVLALLGVIAVGFLARNAQAIAANFGKNFWVNADWHTPQLLMVGGGRLAWVSVFTLIGVVQVGSLFSSDAWNNVTFTAGEMTNPKRNLPLSLVGGTGVVLLLYIACNFVYLSVLPMVAIANAPQDRVATAVMQVAFGAMGSKLMAAAILVSTFGCANGMVLAGARVYYAMSQDKLFFEATGKLDAKTGVPKNALWLQCGWSCLLCLSGQYGNLLDYVIFAVLVFYVLTIVALFRLRRTQPEAPRPYKAFGYPLLPGLYIVTAAFICGVLLRYKPQYTWPGLGIVLLGLPVYFLWQRKTAASAELT